MNHSLVRILLCAWTLGSGSGCLAVPSSAPPLPQLGQAAPAFTLPDAQGKPHALASYRGRSVVLFFYCGCEPCHECARAWADVQRSGELEAAPTVAAGKPEPLQGATGKPKTAQGAAKKPASKAAGAALPPLTLVVYTGAAADASRFVTETALDAKQTVLLMDDTDQAAERYQALACPRAFVLDRRGILRYTNPSPADGAKALAATALVSRVLTELRRCDAPTQPQTFLHSSTRKGTSHAK